jgi:hypothetical protein
VITKSITGQHNQYPRRSEAEKTQINSLQEELTHINELGLTAQDAQQIIARVTSGKFRVKPSDNPRIGQTLTILARLRYAHRSWFCHSGTTARFKLCMRYLHAVANNQEGTFIQHGRGRFGLERNTYRMNHYTLNHHWAASAEVPIVDGLSHELELHEYSPSLLPQTTLDGSMRLPRQVDQLNNSYLTAIAAFALRHHLIRQEMAKNDDFGKLRTWILTTQQLFNELLVKFTQVSYLEQAQRINKQLADLSDFNCIRNLPDCEKKVIPLLNPNKIAQIAAQEQAIRSGISQLFDRFSENEVNHSLGLKQIFIEFEMFYRFAENLNSIEPNQYEDGELRIQAEVALKLGEQLCLLIDLILQDKVRLPYLATYNRRLLRQCMKEMIETQVQTKVDHYVATLNNKRWQVLPFNVQRKNFATYTDFLLWQQRTAKYRETGDNLHVSARFPLLWKAYVLDAAPNLEFSLSEDKPVFDQRMSNAALIEKFKEYQREYNKINPNDPKQKREQERNKAKAPLVNQAVLKNYQLPGSVAYNLNTTCWLLNDATLSEALNSPQFKRYFCNCINQLIADADQQKYYWESNGNDYWLSDFLLTEILQRMHKMKIASHEGERLFKQVAQQVIDEFTKQLLTYMAG